MISSIAIDCGGIGTRPSTTGRLDGPIGRFVAGLYCALAGAEPIPQRHLLLLRFALANLVALALVGAAAGQGWIGTLLAADSYGLVRAIVAVFVVGLVWGGQRVLVLSRALDEIERFAAAGAAPKPAHLRRIEGRAADSRAILAGTLRLSLSARIAPLRHIAGSLVLLGLIGTVIGFVIALSGVRPEMASDVGAIGPMVASLIEGMSIALHTTLIGSLLHLWLTVNLRLLEDGTIKLLTATIEQGERHARS